MQATILCYRYYAFDTLDYDEEQIWRDVQSWGGHLTIRQDCIDFFIPRDRQLLFLLKYPELARRSDLDLI